MAFKTSRYHHACSQPSSSRYTGRAPAPKKEADDNRCFRLLIYVFLPLFCMQPSTAALCPVIPIDGNILMTKIARPIHRLVAVPSLPAIPEPNQDLQILTLQNPCRPSLIHHLRL